MARVHIWLSRLFYKYLYSDFIPAKEYENPIKFFAIQNETPELDPGMFYPSDYPIESLRGRNRRATISRHPSPDINYF